MVNEDFKKYNVLQYDVGEDITALLLDSNDVYWSGSKLAYKPERYFIHHIARFKLPPGIAKITHLGTCFRCVVVATEDGKLYFKNKFM